MISNWMSLNFQLIDGETHIPQHTYFNSFNLARVQIGPNLAAWFYGSIWGGFGMAFCMTIHLWYLTSALRSVPQQWP